MRVGVLFDLDGTLLDTLGDLHSAVNHTLAQFDCPGRTLDEVRRFVGNGARRLIELALPGREDDPPVDTVLAAFQTYYKAHCQQKTRPYPGIPEMFAKVRDAYPVAVVSNKPDPAVKALCGLYFSGVYALGVTPDCPRKPAPDMVERAMAQMGVVRCVYVGDSEVDVLTAKNAGVPCLSVLWGFRDRAEIEAVGGKYFCEDPAALPAMVKQILEKEL